MFVSVSTDVDCCPVSNYSNKPFALAKNFSIRIWKEPLEKSVVISASASCANCGEGNTQKKKIQLDKSINKVLLELYQNSTYGYVINHEKFQLDKSIKKVLLE